MRSLEINPPLPLFISPATYLHLSLSTNYNNYYYLVLHIISPTRFFSYSLYQIVLSPCP